MYLMDSSSMIVSEADPNLFSGSGHSIINLGDAVQVVLMLSPHGRGSFPEQAQQALSAVDAVLTKLPQTMTITLLTVFLRNPCDRVNCEQILADYFGSKLPVINFVIQPPCCGSALSLEAWGIGGNSVQVEYRSSQALAVSYDDTIRSIYCAGIKPADSVRGVYAQTVDALQRMDEVLNQAGSRFEHVVRTWLYLEGITENEEDKQRYKELNRARADYYNNIRFCSSLVKNDIVDKVYPSSTCIGTAETGLLLSCLTLETQREDVFLVQLENPAQTPAYDYPPIVSFQSPKFSRAMALVIGDYITTWISGTASIVNFESLHLDDIEKQTQQTIDNIERLISPENFASHGVKGAGASLHDLAQVRVYLKRPHDFAGCKAVCERRFGSVPIIYSIADVCRPELLVEIEGAAFSRYWRTPKS
ncbi:MAG: RidA family protein [Thermodesulfovibrionales bacterium]